MKNHLDAFDQWILTDNWNINNWGMDTYYGSQIASKVGSHSVFWHFRFTMLVNINIKGFVLMIYKKKQPDE